MSTEMETLKILREIKEITEDSYERALIQQEYKNLQFWISVSGLLGILLTALTLEIILRFYDVVTANVPIVSSVVQGIGVFTIFIGIGLLMRSFFDGGKWYQEAKDKAKRISWLKEYHLTKPRTSIGKLHRKSKSRSKWGTFFLLLGFSFIIVVNLIPGWWFSVSAEITMVYYTGFLSVIGALVAICIIYFLK